MQKFALISTILSLFGCSLFSQNVISGFNSTVIGSAWNEPVGTAFSADGQRLFVWEKGGRVFVCNRNASGNYIKQTVPVIDISEEVGNWRDLGLLGFAIDPQFITNGYIYLLYVVDRHYLMYFGTPSYSPTTNDYFNATIGRLTRYKTATSGGNLVTDMTSRKILIGETKSTGIPILYESHGVGSLVFAADGTLLVSAGDGASYNTTDAGSSTDTYYAQALTDGIIRPNENVGAFRSQLLNSHNGKILRIDPSTGNGIPSNPFYNAAQPRSPKSRVWAFGFRNPFRMVIKPGTGSTNPATGDIGEIYVSDVGWGTWEELDIVKEAGVNCGWPLYEGLSEVSSYFDLATENKDEPNPLYGTGGCTQHYFTFKSLLKQATADGIKTVYNPCDASRPIGTGNRYFHRRPAIDCRHDQDLARVPIFSGNNAAVATIGSAASGVTGIPYRGNCAIAGCWYMGNLFPINFRNTFLLADYGRTWIKAYTVNYTDVIQTVQDFASGFVGIVSITENPLDGTIVCVDIGNNTITRISYGGNQLPVVRMSSNKTYGPSVLSVNFTGSASFDPDGGSLTYLWNFGDNSTSTAANPPTHNFSAPSNTPKKFVVKLTVTDNQGGKSTDSIIISVNNTPPIVHITSPVNNSIYTLGPDTVYACTAHVTDAEQSPGQLSYAWESILRHNNHQHPEPIDTNRITSTVISRIGCNGDTYYWLIRLTVTDAAGLSGSDSSKLFPPCGSNLLPLGLRKFSVSQQGNSNVVRWVTENAHIKTFEVERSADGRNFISINIQDARSTTGVTEYSFVDNTFPRGINYYRLKLTDVANVITYSPTVKTGSPTKEKDLDVSPNPIVGNFSIRFTAANDGVVKIRITDMNGRQVASIHENVNRGENIIYIQNMPTWPAGMYMITAQQGNDVRSGKLIKGE